MNNEEIQTAGLPSEDGQTYATLPPVTVDTAHPGAIEVPKIPATATGDDTAVSSVASQQQAGSIDLSRVTNADFLAEVFHNVPPGTSPVVCSKHGDPTAGGPWIPQPASKVHGLAANTNNYFNCATFKPETDGTFKARKDNAVGYYCLVLDDVGKKVAFKRLGGIKPSWVTETSPGNYQVGFIFSEPVTAAEYARLQNAIQAAELSDPGAVGAVRWWRLPVAINGKEKYKSGASQRFHCRLRRWHPERRYNVSELVAMLTLDLNAAPAPLTHESEDEAAETVVAQHERESDPASLGQLEKLLAAINPDCARQDWLRVLMAVFHETGGSDDGLALVDEWSSKGVKYKDTKDIEVQWRSFKSDVEKPITIGSLIWMARQAGGRHKCDHATKPCRRRCWRFQA